jgi:hypothetical protein
LGIFVSDISEIGPGPDGYNIRTRVNDMFHPLEVEDWHLQYGTIHRADDINGRTIDGTFADLSNTINKIDESVYHGNYLDSDGNPYLGFNNEYPLR